MAILQAFIMGMFPLSEYEESPGKTNDGKVNVYRIKQNAFVVRSTLLQNNYTS